MNTQPTQPEALRLANVCSNLTRYSMDAHLIAAELRRQHTRIAELEAELEAVGAGGVQALSAAPAGFVPVAAFDRLHAHAESLAARLLAAEQAAPKAAAVVWLSSKQLRGITALHGQYLPFRLQPEGRFDVPVYLEEAAPKAAPVRACVCGEPQASGTVHRVDGPCYVAAPQQEAQEPIALLVRKNSWRAGQWEAAPPDSPSYGLAWADQRQYVYAAPQPAPAPLSDDVVKDAARWRWLSEHIGAAWNEGKFTSLVRIVSDKNRAALNASIDRMMTGDWSDAALAAQGGKV